MNRNEQEYYKNIERIAKALEKLVKLEKFKNPLYGREINKENNTV
jgi:hypothetical protein